MQLDYFEHNAQSNIIAPKSFLVYFFSFEHYAYFVSDILHVSNLLFNHLSFIK